MTIPLIVPYYNAPTYVKNLVNWWRWYRPDDPVHILSNRADRIPGFLDPNVFVHEYPQNAARQNLATFLADFQPPWYVISDPDIMPHPGTPPWFLDVFKHAIETHGFHHVGFQLAEHDRLPSWVPPIIREDAARNEAPHHDPGSVFEVAYQGATYMGHRAAIDTTFALYCAANGGWSSPMPGAHWGNSLRLFEAFHLGWYLPPDPNPEMTHYFETCATPLHLEPVTGKNTYRPAKFYDRANRQWQEHFDALPADVRAARVPPKE